MEICIAFRIVSDWGWGGGNSESCYQNYIIQKGWEKGGSRGRKYVYTFSWFTLYNRTNNTVKQLYSNKKIHIQKYNMWNPLSYHLCRKFLFPEIKFFHRLVMSGYRGGGFWSLAVFFSAPLCIFGVKSLYWRWTRPWCVLLTSKLDYNITVLLTKIFLSVEVWYTYRKIIYHKCMVQWIFSLQVYQLAGWDI